jgi:hypothetical protein
MLEDAPHGVDEAVHPPVVDVEDGEAVTVRAAVVPVTRVVERTVAPRRQRVPAADGRAAVSHRDAVRARVGPEVGVERPVLLHDHDDVPDLVDAGARRRCVNRSQSSARASRLGRRPGMPRDEPDQGRCKSAEQEDGGPSHGRMGDDARMRSKITVPRASGDRPKG